jgi:hypothetical protein
LESGSDGELKGYVRLNIVLTVEVNLFYRYFSAFYLSYRLSPRTGESFEARVLAAIRGPLLARTPEAILPPGMPKDCFIRAFLAGGKTYPVGPTQPVIQVKSPWIAPDGSLRASSKKRNRSLELFLIGSS